MTDPDVEPSKRWRWGWIGAVAAALVLGCTIWIPAGHGAIPIIFIPFGVVYNYITHYGENVATVGNPPNGSVGGDTLPVSERFGTAELHQLYDRINSEAFRSSLTNYNCGDPVPAFQFALLLNKRVPAASRRVNVRFSPALDFAGPQRCLSSRLSQMLEQTSAEIDPTPRPRYHDQELVCDCSKRGGTQEWVTWKVPTAPPQP